MRTTITIILLLANLVSSGALAEAEYFVQIDTDEPRRAQVAASIVSGEHGLCFSRSADDTGLTHGWATFVHKLAVNDANGQSVNAEYDGDGCWRSDSNGRVTVSYTMLLMHDKFPNMPGDDELAMPVIGVNSGLGAHCSSKVSQQERSALSFRYHKVGP